MNPSLFQQEDLKYSQLWSRDYREANWHKLASALLSRVDKRVPSLPRVIDFGCGNGKALEFFTRAGLRCTGVDISSYACEQLSRKGYSVVHSSLDSLAMFEDGAFSYGFSNDVLEHLPESCVESSLAEMSRLVSHDLFVSVCPTPSHRKSLDGQGLHLTIKPVQWWEQQLSAYGKVTRLRFYLSRSQRFMVEKSA